MSQTRTRGGGRNRNEVVSKILKNIYHKPDHPASYSSPYKLYYAAKKINPTIKLSEVKEWLTGEPAYTLHREIKLSFPRRKVVVYGMKIQYQADLVDYVPIAKENKGNKFVLTVIDCFSRFACAKPLKNKTGEVVLEQLKAAFEEMGYPKKLQTDQGKEFYNKHVQTFLKENDIHHFSTFQEYKAQIVERFNRTLRGKVAKYMRANNTLKYVDILPQILKSYNSSIHGSLNGLAPQDVNKKNERDLFHSQYGLYLAERNKNAKFKINDTVRIAEYRNIFKKGHEQNFTDEIFVITDILYTNPITYKVKSHEKSDHIDGSFYAEQLQKVKIN